MKDGGFASSGLITGSAVFFNKPHISRCSNDLKAFKGTE